LKKQHPQGIDILVNNAGTVSPNNLYRVISLKLCRRHRNGWL
jgi:hypothetical protein